MAMLTLVFTISEASYQSVTLGLTASEVYGKEDP